MHALQTTFNDVTSCCQLPTKRMCYVKMPYCDHGIKLMQVHNVLYCSKCSYVKLTLNSVTIFFTKQTRSQAMFTMQMNQL